MATEGQKPTSVHLILEGFACRYKYTAEGNRQIMAYLVPGDFCDLHVFVLKQMDHSIGTISPCLVVDIPQDQILKLLQSPKLSLALWCAALVDAAVLREWLVNVGQRRASLIPDKVNLIEPHRLGRSVDVSRGLTEQMRALLWKSATKSK